MPVILGRRPKVRFRYWRNRSPVADRAVEVSDLETAITVATDMLVPGDRFLIVVEDPTGAEKPWFYGNDSVLGQKVAREDYGEKLPEGEVSWQQRHGVRVPPELNIPTV